MNRDEHIQWLEDQIDDMSDFLLEMRKTIERLTDRVAALEAKQADD